MIPPIFVQNVYVMYIKMSYKFHRIPDTQSHLITKVHDLLGQPSYTPLYFINNVYFDNIVSQIYPSELQLNKANTSDTEAAFLDLHLSISNNIVSTKLYDKCDDFDFEIVNTPFLDGMFLALHPIESISLNSFVLLEHLATLLT